MHGDQLVGDPCRRLGGGGDRRQQRPQRAVRKSVTEELRHVLVQVEQERNAAQLEGSGGKDQEVGQRRHLYQSIGATAMCLRKTDRRDPGESQVLGHVSGKAAERTMHRQPEDPHGPDALLCSVAAIAQAEDVDLVAGRDERIGLTAQSRVGGIDGMCHQGQSAQCDLTSFHSASFASGERSARTMPRVAASASAAW